MANRHLNKGRLFLTLALISGIIYSADAIRRDYSVITDSGIVVDGTFKDPSAPVQDNNNTMLGNTTQPASQAGADFSNLGYSEFSVPSAQLSSGMLTLIDEAHPCDTTANPAFVSLAEKKNSFYTLRSDDLLITASAAEALNNMMSDYNAATGLSDFIVYSTTQPYTADDSVCSGYFPESVTGNTIDLAVQGQQRVLEYDGKDEEAWIVENCASYGFIVRYPQGKETAHGKTPCVWHLRYVGKVHSSVMAQNNLCLEEYLGWIKSYTFDSAPLITQCDGVTYEIYYAPSMGDTTAVRVPVSGNYSISGNNSDGYIITAVK